MIHVVASPAGWIHSPSERAEHHSGRVVTGRANDAAGGVAPGATEVEPLHRRLVGQPVREAPLVVHMMDVAAGNPEVALNLGRREGEVLLHQLAGAGGEAVADGQEVLHVARLLLLPGGALEGVR